MWYFWQKCEDPYQRIAAWRSSNDVYILMRAKFLGNERTRVSVRFLYTERDIELLIGDGAGAIEGLFVKLDSNHRTAADIRRQAEANREILRREGLTPEDLIRASTSEVLYYRSKPFINQYSDALERLCRVWFRGETL